MQVIVHGGAGGSPAEPERRRAVLADAAERGAGTETPMDAVEQSIRVLESSVRFNAGVGGAVQSDGTIRTDAGVMTEDRSAGAACAMPGVEHAISAARVVLEETPHVLVAGGRAVALAADSGVETGVDLWSDRTREKWEELDVPADAGPVEQLAWVHDHFGRTDPCGREDGRTAAGTPDEHDPGTPDEHDHDTVGAVARAGDRLAAATSTGGRWFAMAGRVGDVPQIGAGFYCAPAGGASATGDGEDIARATLSRRAVRHLERGCGVDEAAELAIEEFGALTGASAGVILLDADGNAASAFNSDAMQTARARR